MSALVDTLTIQWTDSWHCCLNICNKAKIYSTPSFDFWNLRWLIHVLPCTNRDMKPFPDGDNRVQVLLYPSNSQWMDKCQRNFEYTYSLGNAKHRNRLHSKKIYFRQVVMHKVRLITLTYNLIAVHFKFELFTKIIETFTGLNWWDTFI
jgi:hypothetical protein